jgi:CHAD domain-containing protein
MRRLLPILKVALAGHVFHILNTERKTVTRIELWRGELEKPGEGARPMEPFLGLRPLRGYESAFQDAAQILQANTSLRKWAEPLFDRLFKQAGVRPLSYSSKLRIGLSPKMPTGVAVQNVLCNLFETMRLNEQGTIDNLDSEFLHDFRVAVRRTRSVLSQLKKDLPGSIRRFRKEFAWLGELTGPTRDLDVYLLKMEGYKASLPEAVAEDLDALEAFLLTRHEEEHRRLVRGLKSARYAKLTAAWSEFLSHLTEELADRPDTPVIQTANRRIRKVFRRLLKNGGRIDDRSPAEDLHRLRIEAKRLRYLMEFFRSLYPKKEIRGLIKSLRRLQDNLGDFNDFQIQQEALFQFAQQMVESGNADARTLMAMGRLIDRLDIRQAEEREKFHQHFDRFSAEENQARFESLFGDLRVNQ